MLTQGELWAIEAEVDEISGELKWLDPKWESHRIEKHNQRLNELIDLIEQSTRATRRRQLRLIK